jgi:2-dehydro-3-deoxyphosphogluconate aldolase / (4S)-4-hydroxy-2-oxoglutarate aldolase
MTLSPADIGSLLIGTGVQAIPELIDRDDAVEVVEALIAAGIKCIEILLPGQRGIERFREIVAAVGDRACIGAGSVVDPGFAEVVLEAGAAIVVTPILAIDVVRVVKDAGRVVICGALTPTECVAATKAGADFVKVFPVNALGPAAVRTMLVPLPDLRIVASGSVNQTNAPHYIRAGAVAVAAGYFLVGSKERPLPYEAVVERARNLLAAVQSARQTLKSAE